MKRLIYIFLLAALTACDSFEKQFYNSIDKGQINAIKNGVDTFDLSTITDFEWDRVVLIRGNESVPVFKEEIEEIINNQTGNIHWENRRFKDKKDPKFVFKTSDLPLNKDRFYFLTPDKKIIEKEIKSGIDKHRPAFSMEYCLIDSIKKRHWLSKKECIFILKSNVRTAGEGTVFLYPNCITKFSPDSIKIHDN